MSTEENTLAEAENQQNLQVQSENEEQAPADGAGASPAMSEAENTDAETIEADPPRKNRAEDRIHQLVKERNEYQQKAIELERQLATREAPEPVKDAYEYETDADYHRDLARSIAVETQKEMKEAAAREAREAAAQASQRAFHMRVEEAMATIPDIQQSINIVADMVSPEAADMIINSDQSIELVNYLAKNPFEAQGLKTMSPIQVARTIGQLETRVQRPATKKISTAPAPVKTVSGNSGSSGKSLDEMSHAEYVAYRQQKGFNRIG